MESCFLCQRPVLGFVGSDDFLNPTYICTNDSDLLKNDQFGECHSKCLSESRFQDRWANLRIDSLSANRGYSLRELADARVCFNSNGTSAFVVLMPSLKCIAVNVSMLIQDSSKMETLFVEHEVNWELGELKRRFSQQALLISSEIELAEVVANFGVEELYDDLLTSSGTFRCNQETARNFGLGFLSGTVRYPLNLPYSVCEIIKRAMLLKI